MVRALATALTGDTHEILACHRLVIVAGVVALGLAACTRGTDADGDAAIVALDAMELRAELAAGRLSAERVTEAFLRRIAALDKTGPALNAVIEINPDALAIARELDGRRPDGVVGPLHGIPVLIKANIDTADGMATSAGSLALAEHRAANDAEVVARLRAAGAVLLGKTNLSEWANFRSTNSTSGWSSLGGQTHNAYVLDRNPCGSSSGSAAAVAARLAPLAVGTETDGSIVCPAAVNGIVGVKPTTGLVSQTGIVPIAGSQDTAGPMARTAADAELLLAVLAGRDVAGSPPLAEIAALRLGVLRDYSGAGRDPLVEAAFEQALAWLRAAGATLVDPADMKVPDGLQSAEMTILLTEFRAQLGEYLGAVEHGPRTLDALIEFNEAHAAEVMPYFGQELLLAARDAGDLNNADYRAALATVADFRVRLADAFAVQRLDALVAPSNARVWKTDWARGDGVGVVWVGDSAPAAVSGFPSVTVPVALAAELPLGVSLLGPADRDTLLLAIARVLEQARGPFPEPQFLPSAGD